MRLQHIWGDRRGSVAVMAAIGMTGLVGVAGFAIDFGAAYVQTARLQKVADSAAMAGAIAYVKSSSSAAATATISAVVVANGWPASIIQTAATGYMKVSPKNGANPAVQVSLAAPSTLSLARVMTKLLSVTTSAYSAAEIGGSSGATACLVALQTLMINGSIIASGCTVQANGTGSPSITLNSGASVTATALETPGGVTNNGTINGNVITNTKVSGSGKINGNTTSGASTVQDPYASMQSQASSGFTGCQNYANQTTLAKPGCYSNVNVNSGTTLTLTSGGTYFFPNINVNSGGAITGTNVTMVTQSSFSPSGSVTLTAPTTGSWAGMALYAMGGMNINSGVTFKVNGAIYAPTGTIIPNSGTWNANACTFLVAQNLTFNSGASFTLPQQGCSAYAGTAPNFPGTSTIALVQ
jgi:Flp pilus assembly protein TadG